MKANRLPNMLAFNGSSDYLTLPIVPAVTGFNLAFWAIKRNQVDGKRVIEWADAGYSKGFTIIEKTGAFELSTRDSGTTATLLSSAKPNARLVHIAATHDGTTLKLYENSVLVGTDAAAAYTVPTAPLTIAREAGFSGNFWNGLMGELVFHSTATPWTQDQITDLYYNGNIPSGASYWLFNGNVLDGSGNGNNGTLTGGTYVYQNAGRITPRFMGGSTLFNGSTSKINTTLNITDYNAITVSFWYKQSRYVSDVRLLANGHTDSDNTGFMFWIVANKILFHVGNGIANTNAQSVSEIARDISGKWIHCIGTYNGTVVRLYLNGVLSSNDAISTLSGNIANTAYPVAIGYNPVFNGAYSNGKIAEVKIFNSALTASQAAELYSTGSVSGVSPVADYALDDQPSTYIDSIGGNNATGSNTALSVDTPVVGRQRNWPSVRSCSLPGASSQVYVANSATNMPANYFSVNFWMYPGSSFFGSYHSFLHKNYKVKLAAVSGGIYVAVNTGTEAGFITPLIPKGQWSMITVTFDGTLAADNLKAYINGKFAGKTTKTGTVTDTSANPWVFGNDSSSGLIGYLDDVSVDITRAYTAAEVLQMFNNGYPPTGYGVYLKFDEESGNALDSSGNNNFGVFANSAVRSPLVPKKGDVAIQPLTGSAEFNGSNSGLTLPFVPDLTGFTILFRLKIMSGTPNGSVFFGWESAADRDGFTIKFDTSTALIVCVASSASSPDSILVGLNKMIYGKWYDMAMTYQPNVHRLWIDSVINGSDLSITATTNATTPILGRRSYSNISNAKCKISGFAYCDDVLTQAEIAAYFRDGVLPASARNRWKLDDTAGSYADSIAGATGTGTSMTKSTDAPTIARTAV